MVLVDDCLFFSKVSVEGCVTGLLFFLIVRRLVSTSMSSGVSPFVYGCMPSRPVRSVFGPSESVRSGC